MTASPAPSAQYAGDKEAFAFVQELATELTRGKVELPSFPDIAMRVRQVLADEYVKPEQVVRVVSSEPALAAQLLQIANSAAINPSGKPVNDLRAAVARMGFNMVRTAAIGFAMAQLKKVEQLKGLEQQLDDLWRRSSSVAAMSYVVAKRYSQINPDSAMLAGLLHTVGRLYILTRAAKHPGLFRDTATYNAIVRDWGSAVAKALLENWRISDEIVAAVNEYEDHQRRHSGPVDLVDVLTAGQLLSLFKESPDDIELNLHNVAACERMRIDADTYRTLIEECNEEIEQLRAALGM
jgi:HD-like signal output (HDOD) protein